MGKISRIVSVASLRKTDQTPLSDSFEIEKNSQTPSSVSVTRLHNLLSTSLSSASEFDLKLQERW